MVDYQLRRCSRRKNIAVKVQNAQVIVTAPSHVSDSYISHLIAKKESWLKSKINQQEISKTFANDISLNGQLWFDGRCIPLVVGYDGTGTSFQNDHIYCGLAKRYRGQATESLQKHLKKQLETWYALTAKNTLPARLQQIAESIGLIPENVSVRKYKARWGSCDNKAHIKLNYFLMMLPKHVIDYVLVHELCHLKHLNHSQAFWQLVACHNPNFADAKNWLKENQRYLIWPDT